MARRTIHSLGAMVRAKRGQGKLRATAGAIGISAPTLLRVEEGRIPDIDTFGKICRWLGADPKEFLGFNEQKDGEPKHQPSPAIIISAHFRADKTAKPQTIQALATMLLLASNELAPTRIPVDGDS